VTTAVLFVRHVPHEFQDKVFVARQPGVRLAADAPQRLQRLATRFSRERLAAIYASPMERTQETAAAIAAPLKLPVVTRDDFIEIDFGEWTGRPFEEVQADPRHQVWNRMRGLARAPGGESMLDVQARMVRGIKRLRAEHPDQTVAVVSHGDPIKTAIMYALGLPLDFYDRFELEPGSISTVVFGDWGAKVLRLNETVDA
jgi:probable phosphoglycerate mutase